MESWDISYSAAECRRALQQAGLTVVVERDQDTAAQHLDSLGKCSSPILDPGKHIFTRSSAVWFFAYLDGNPIMGCGARIDSLEGECLDGFLMRAIPRTFGGKVSSEPGMSLRPSLTGKAAYVGDLRSKTNDYFSSGQQELLGLFSAFTQYVVFDAFKADFSYCFLRYRQAARLIHYGFLDCDPFPFAIEPPMYPDGNPGWLAVLERERLGAVLNRAVRDFALPVQQKPEAVALRQAS